MKNDEINGRIYDLLNQRNYELLSEKDKMFLLSQNINEDKFNNLVKTEICLNERFVDFKEEIPDEMMLDNLMSSIPKQKRKNLILMKLPAYYTIAASLLMFLFSWTLFTNMNESTITLKEKLIYDTIYISNQADMAEKSETYKPSENISKVNNIIKKSQNKRNVRKVEADEIQNSELPFNEFVGLGNVKFATKQSKGINNNDDTVVSKFRYTMQSDKMYVLNNHGN